MIKLTMIGHLGSDATVKEVSGKKVVNFSIAHTEKYKVGDVSHERTTWVNCGLWESTKVAEYLKKGTQVYVEGAPSANAWSDKDGVLKADIRLTVFKLELLGSGNKNKENKSEAETSPAADIVPAAPSGAIVDDLPF